MNNQAIFLLVAIICIGFTGYTFVKSIQTFRRFLTQSKELQSKEYTVVNNSTASVLISIAAAVVCVVLGYMTYAGQMPVAADQLPYYLLAYLVLAIVFFGQSFEIYAHRNILFANDRFWYNEKFYRYRMISGYEVKRNPTRAVKVKFANNEEITLSRKMALEVEHREQAWKAAKKARKAKRK
ncbi:hypothetical protein [Catenisphaera adipataccumulans]|nr:hypothetical protein [Catenisphaera adipataccumulans]